MPLNQELAPIYAIIKVFEVTFSNGKIDHVIAEVSYPLITITHRMKITRADLVQLLRSGEQVSYQKNPWTAGDDGLINPVENMIT